MSETKRCLRCKEEKSRTEFNRNRSKPGGFARYCRTCANALTRKWDAKNPFRRLALSAIARMRMRGIPFNADSKELAADIEFLWDCQGSECSVCGVEIVLGSRGGRAAADAAQLDALNPSRPYQQGNMSFLCAPCNGSKGDLTIETTRRLYQFLLEEVDVDH